MFVTMVRFKFHSEATMQSGRVSKVANKYLWGMGWHDDHLNILIAAGWAVNITAY